MDARFTVQVRDFLTAATTASKAISQKNTMPILSDLKITLNEGLMEVKGMDYDCSITVGGLAIAYDGETTSFCVEAARLIEGLRHLAQDSGLDVVVSGNSITASHASGSFTLPLMDAGEYPVERMGDPDGESVIAIGSGKLADALKRCYPMTCKDDLRPVMQTVCVRLGDNGILDLVGSDGRALTKWSVSYGAYGKPFEILIPRRIVEILCGLLPEKEVTEVRVYDLDKYAIATFGDVTLRFRVVEGRYPNYDSVIPSKANATRVSFSRAALVEGVTRTFSFSPETSRLLKVNVKDGGLVLQGQDFDYSCSAEENVEASVSGDSQEIGLNGQLLMGALKALNGFDEIAMSVTSKDMPVIMEPVGDIDIALTILVVPMLIG